MNTFDFVVLALAAWLTLNTVAVAYLAAHYVREQKKLAATLLVRAASDLRAKAGAHRAAGGARIRRAAFNTAADNLLGRAKTLGGAR